MATEFVSTPGTFQARKSATARRDFLNGHGCKAQVSKLPQSGQYVVRIVETDKTCGELDALLASVSNWWMAAA